MPNMAVLFVGAITAHAAQAHRTVNGDNSRQRLGKKPAKCMKRKRCSCRCKTLDPCNYQCAPSQNVDLLTQTTKSHDEVLHEIKA